MHNITQLSLFLPLYKNQLNPTFCMKTWPLVCLKLLSVGLPQIYTSSPAQVPSLKLFWWIQRKQKTAKMIFCDALTCSWNNLGDYRAAPTHVALWMPSKGSFSWAHSQTQELLQGYWTRGAEPDFWMDNSETFLKSSHNGEVFWRKLFSNCWKSGQNRSTEE